MNYKKSKVAHAQKNTQFFFHMWILASKLNYVNIYVRVGVNRGQRT